MLFQSCFSPFSALFLEVPVDVTFRILMGIETLPTSLRQEVANLLLVLAGDSFGCDWLTFQACFPSGFLLRDGVTLG